MGDACAQCKRPLVYDGGAAFEAGRFGVIYASCECEVTDPVSTNIRNMFASPEYDKIRHASNRSALYASIISRAYERLVESQEPEDAMRAAIEKAEEVVMVWEKVVSNG